MRVPKCTGADVKPDLAGIWEGSTTLQLMSRLTDNNIENTWTRAAHEHYREIVTSLSIYQDAQRCAEGNWQLWLLELQSAFRGCLQT